MIRNLKVLGLAAVAALALSATMASVASANFTSAAYPATANATSTADVFDAFGSTVVCTNNSFTGSLTAASSTLTITPTYKNCKVGGVLPATVNFTSCDYVFHTTTGGARTVDIECTTAGDAIDITVYASEAAHTANTPICHIRVPQQTGLTGYSLANNGDGTVQLSGTVSNITATQVRNSFLCPTGTHTTESKYTIQSGGIKVSGNNGAIAVS